jgi:2-hydroxychromene-2-carboxylate isomerase
MARRIDYFFSAVSPWAYIGHAAFHDLVQEQGCAVTYKPVFLGELFAETGGLPLTKRHPARQRYRIMELQRWREKRGLSFHLQPKYWPFDTRLADGVIVDLGRRAQSRRCGDACGDRRRARPAGAEADRARGLGADHRSL